MARHHMVWLTVLAMTLGGCHLFRSHEALNYQTVVADPHCDPEKAKKENERALCDLEKCKFDKAEQSLQRALIADVHCGSAHNNLGYVYFSQHKYYLAAWEFEYAMKLMPESPEPLNNLGQVYEAVGRLNDAVSYYQSANQMSPKNPEFLGNLVRARMRRGDSLNDLRDLLQDIVFLDTRPEWTTWARQQLNTKPVPEVKTTSPQPSMGEGAGVRTLPPAIQGENVSLPSIPITASTPTTPMPAAAPMPEPQDIQLTPPHLN